MMDKALKGKETVKILQFNQMRGIHQGKRSMNNKERVNQNVFELESQIGTELPGNYLIAVVEGDKIVDWVPSKMYDMRSTAVLEQQTETKMQKWSLQHKKNMVSQFGTSKSKRKLNQMMNNIIE